MDRVEKMQGIADANTIPDLFGFNKMRDDLTKAIIEEEDAKFLGYKKPTQVGQRGHLRFMIGLPRSGKSTWADKWVTEGPRVTDGFVFPRVIVCADNIRLAVTGHRFNSRAEPTVFMIKEYMIESLLARGHDVLVDGTHTTKASIKKNFEIDLEAQWTLINTPVEVCKQRAIDTGQSDLLPVLNRIGQQLKNLVDAGVNQVCESLREEVRKTRLNQGDKIV